MEEAFPVNARAKVVDGEFFFYSFDFSDYFCLNMTFM